MLYFENSPIIILLTKTMQIDHFQTEKGHHQKQIHIERTEIQFKK